MHPELLTKKDISSLLNMCPATARDFLARNGVFPVNVGLGKTPRLRWKRFEVMTCLDTIGKDIYKEPRQHKTRRKKSDNTIFTQSVAEIMQSLSTLQ